MHVCSIRGQQRSVVSQVDTGVAALVPGRLGNLPVCADQCEVGTPIAALALVLVHVINRETVDAPDDILVVEGVAIEPNLRRTEGQATMRFRLLGVRKSKRQLGTPDPTPVGTG